MIFTFARWLKTLHINVLPREFHRHVLLIQADSRQANLRPALTRHRLSNGVFLGRCPRISRWWRALRKSSLKHNSPDEASSAAVALAKVQPFFFFPWWSSPLSSLLLCMCSRLLDYLWHNISRLCDDAAYGCSRQHGVSPLSCVWVICLISLAVIENWRLMLLIWPFCIKGIHI